MKRIYLFLLIVYENLLKIVLLFGGMFVSVILLLSVFSSASKYIDILRHAEYGNFDEYVFVGNLGDPTAFLKLDYIDDLKSIVNIEVEEYSNNLYLMQGLSDPSVPHIDYYVETLGTPSYSDIQVDLYSGRMPEAPNEVVLTKRSLEYYSIGQSITLDWVNILEDDSIDPHPVTLTIVGIIEDDVMLKKCGGVLYTNSDYSCLLELDSYLNYPFDRHFAIVSDGTVFCDDNVPLKPRNPAQILTCRSTAGETPTELRNRILQAFPDLVNSTYEGEALHDAYIRNNRTIFSQLLIAILILFLLIFCFLIGSLYLQARKKALEMTVIYMQGMTWISSISMVFAAYLPGILLGIACGIYCFYPLSENFLSNESRFRLEYVLISAGICLLLSLLCMIPIYIELARRSPIETIRKD